MKTQWLNYCVQACSTPSDLYASERKILRNVTQVYDWNDDMALIDSGYTGRKLSMLTKAYVHEPSRDMALRLWADRIASGKFGSVGFHTYSHLLKSEKTSRIASVQGPCLTSVVITSERPSKVAVNVSYRSTELFKKFGADLAFIRSVLLGPFPLNGLTVELHCDFANMTVHPMYVATIAPHLSDPVSAFQKIREGDPRFWALAVKRTAAYLCNEYSAGIAKHASSMRVKRDVNRRLDRDKAWELREYLRDVYPGNRRPRPRVIKRAR